MNNTSNLIYQNINNLTSLWEEVSQVNNSLVQTDLYNYIAVENSDWPNRVWFHRDPDEQSLLFVKSTLFARFPRLTLPYWDIYESDTSSRIEQNGFVKRFEQTAMCLRFDAVFDVRGVLAVELVSSLEQAKLWSRLFALSFGYEIQADLLFAALARVCCYIAYFEGEAVGTAITYQTGNVTGIHSVGIIPEGRRKGLANELMKVLLNVAIENKSEYATLQASDMGKLMYQNLGFEEQFVIKNYVL